MDNKESILKATAFLIISNENLPVPTQIRFKRGLTGNKNRIGCCSRQNSTNSFRININCIRAKFYPDKNGKYTDKTTNKKFSKCTIGEEIPFNKIVHTTAHEIAHLKFWKHDAQHKSYTKHILSILQLRLGIKNIIT